MRDPELGRDDKIEILRRWEYDELELQVAEEENMRGPGKSFLDEILEALRSLHALRSGRGPPTKHGDV